MRYAGDGSHTDDFMFEELQGHLIPEEDGPPADPPAKPRRCTKCSGCRKKNGAPCEDWCKPAAGKRQRAERQRAEPAAAAAPAASAHFAAPPASRSAFFLAAGPKVPGAPRECGRCGRSFTHPPAFTSHVKCCKGRAGGGGGGGRVAHL